MDSVIMRYFKLQDGQLIEGSLKSLLPHVSDPQVWSVQELLDAGVYILTEPASVEGYRWIPVTPTWDGTGLVGGWELQERPVVVPASDWDGFLSQFIFPGNELYDGIASKVQAASAFTQEHWQNLRLLLVSRGPLRTREAAISGWEYLKLLLEIDNQPLTADTVAAFEALATAHHILIPTLH